MIKRLFKRPPALMRLSDIIAQPSRELTLTPLSDIIAQSSRELTLPPRVCEVGGKTCLFHRWIDEDKALLKINCFVSAYEQERLLRNFREDAVMPMGTSAEIVRHTYALVEFPDGSVGKVEPECVCFMDRKEHDDATS